MDSGVAVRKSEIHQLLHLRQEMHFILTVVDFRSEAVKVGFAQLSPGCQFLLEVETCSYQAQTTSFPLN